MVRIRHKVGQRGLRATRHGRRWWTWSWRRSRIFLRLWTLGWLGGVYTCVFVYTCVHFCVCCLLLEQLAVVSKFMTPLYNLQILLVNMSNKPKSVKSTGHLKGGQSTVWQLVGRTKTKEVVALSVYFAYFAYFAYFVYFAYFGYRWSPCVDHLWSPRTGVDVCSCLYTHPSSTHSGQAILLFGLDFIACL